MTDAHASGEPETPEGDENRYRWFVEHSSEGIWCVELTPPIPTDVPFDVQLDGFYSGAVLVECNLAMARMYGRIDPRRCWERRRAICCRAPIRKTSSI